VRTRAPAPYLYQTGPPHFYIITDGRSFPEETYGEPSRICGQLE